MFDQSALAIIENLAERWKCDPAAIKAVVEVESAGKFFARVDGRDEPLVRFEGHYFDRLLSGDKQKRARTKKLAHPKAGRIPNPRTQGGRWRLMERAIAIDRQAALSSFSWGVGQVMGSHWKWLGYDCVDALVDEARRDVGGQIALMARFIEKSSLQNALRNEDWRKFARTYNGPAYAKNRYHTKMAASFARHRKAAKSLPTTANADGTCLMLGARGQAVRKFQKRLVNAGYTLMADGLFGLATDKQLRKFQNDQGLAVDGIAGAATLKALVKPNATTIKEIAGNAGEKANKSRKRVAAITKRAGKPDTALRNPISALKRSVLSIFGVKA